MNKNTLLYHMHLGATVITPNNRLSNQLLHDYYVNFLTDNRAIDKPRCIPYKTFLNQLFNQIENQKKPILISPNQQRHIWRNILNHSHKHIVNDGLLAEIQDAYKRCMQWRIDFKDPDFFKTDETAQFAEWQAQFTQILTKKNLISAEELVKYIISKPNFPQINTLIWVAFDEYTPGQIALQDLFQAQNVVQLHYDLPKKITQALQYSAKDKLDEYQNMLDWIISRRKAGDKKIGIVVPNLQNEATELQRRLKRFIPEEEFSLSLGKSLIEYPLVMHALQWLSITKKNITQEQAKILLFSPFITGSKGEFIQRAALLLENTLLKEQHIPFKFFIDEIKLKLPILSNLLKNLTPYPEHAHPMQWAKLFKSRLHELGFPGDYVLDSASYQCYQAFISTFDELMQLGLITTNINAVDALNALEDVIKSTIFQTKQPTTPIQVLGILEASGCSFDSIWVTGLTDLAMPKKTDFSAFIPISLQRANNMPHSSTEKELKLAQITLTRLKRGCDNIVFSYPRLIGDLPQLPSPLIIGFPKLNSNSTPTLEIESELINYHENYTIPLYETETIKGGTKLLANQAMCPFKAFAAHRLHLKPSPQTCEGLDLSERGQLLHKILELVWGSLKTQANLLKTSTKELNQLIEISINKALEPLVKKSTLSFSSIPQEVEFNRLSQLIMTELLWEKERTPFAIEALEETFSLNLAGIIFQVRVDRIDTLLSQDNEFLGKMVIDYKTSLPTYKPWNEERPEAPQLLLYALLDEKINALLFIQLKKGQITCSGLSELPTDIIGFQALKNNEKWSFYQEQWHKQLSELVLEFKNGECAPKPTRNATCTQCEFQNLCRY